MPAVIESTLYASPGGAIVAGSTQQNSRDDLELGQQVVLRSVNAATTYSWTLSFASDSPGSTVPGTPFDGTESSSALLAPEGSTSRDAKFNVDYEGSYLIRLVVDAGLPTEDTQFVRCRVLTLFGALKLIAAGERRDENGVVPVDATPEGWANDHNANMQKLALLLRRVSTTGRVLYVDANRGRDNDADVNDYDNVVWLPGPESSRLEETGTKVRAMAHGDFASINAAIAYALDADERDEPVPSEEQPYFVVVRPGLYVEDLNLAPWVHIIGEGPSVNVGNTLLSVEGVQNGGVTVRTVNATGESGHIYNPEDTYANASCFLFNLRLENTVDSVEPVVEQQGGTLGLVGCSIYQLGEDASQGPVVRCLTPTYASHLMLKNCWIQTEAAGAALKAVHFNANGFVTLEDCNVKAYGTIGVMANDSHYAAPALTMRRTTVVAGGGPAIFGYCSMDLEDCDLSGSDVDVDVNSGGAGAGSLAGNLSVQVTRCKLRSPISVETAAKAGTVNIVTREILGVYPSVVLPDAPGDLPDSWVSTVAGDSLGYTPDYVDPKEGDGADARIPAANRLNAVNVQDALDILVQGLFPLTGSPFLSLESAYNGFSSIDPPTLGSGLGKAINADSGAVRIYGANAPLALDGAEKQGGLQVEGVIDVGGLIDGEEGEKLVDVGHSEIHFNPLMLGAGPVIALGRNTWNVGILVDDPTVPRGYGGAVILADQADPFGAPSPFNLHLRTSNFLSDSGTDRLGNVYVTAGSLQDAASTSLPGDVHIIAGSPANAAVSPGNIFLSPGVQGATRQGAVWFTGNDSLATKCKLVAAGAYVGGVAGVAYIGTPSGLVESFTFAGDEDVDEAVAIFNASAKGFVAVNNGGTIELYAEPNPSSDIVYVGEDSEGDLDAALGGLNASAATFTPGEYGAKVAVDVPEDGRLRVGGDFEVTGTIYGTVDGGGGGGFGDYKSVVAGDHPYTTDAAEGIIGVKLSAGSDIQITLSTDYPTGATVIVKDENRIADAIPAPGGQKITIVDEDSGDIEGSASYDITTNGGAVTLYKNSDGDWFIF